MSDDCESAFRSFLARLRAAWEEARKDWNDEAAKYFETEGWKPIDDEAASMLFALAKLDDDLREIEQSVRITP
jgi:hypothetical protein